MSLLYVDLLGQNILIEYLLCAWLDAGNIEAINETEILALLE